MDDKDLNNSPSKEEKQPENKEKYGVVCEVEKPLNKKLLIGFCIMGVIIIVLIVALIVTINGKNDEPDSKAESTAAEISSAAETSSESKSEESSEADESSYVDDEESEADESKNEGFVLTYSAGNGWEDKGVQMCGLELGISNKTGSAVKEWKLVLEVENLKSCDGWNGTYKIDGNKLTVTNAEYNGEIANGGTCAIGCNIGTASKLKIVSATVNGEKCVVKAGKVSQNNNDLNNNNGENKPSADVKTLLKRSSKAKQGDDWLHTDGNKILDKDGKQVWITGVNWFGYNTGTNTFDGLWNSELVSSVKAIADHGFNLIRVPISAELINQWSAGEYPKANYNNAYNPDLNQMNSLEIFDYFLKLAEENGMKVMPDIHCAETNASGHTVNLWYTDKVSVNDYYKALEWMADRYKDNDTIIAYDLKNEPHGKPDEGKNAAIWNNSKDANNWKYVAETAAKKVLAKNPNVLIMVEGIEIYPKSKSNSNYSSKNSDDYYFNWWGGNLRGVKDYPINLGKYQDKLVYSPHDYGPTVYKQPWFDKDYDYNSLMKDCWNDNWFFIQKDNIAPLLIGEWGGFMTEPNLTWMTHMRKLIKTYHINHTFWCFNANSGDTGGLVLDDFTTWDEEKYKFVKDVLWQEKGKFVGLDHEIALGKKGITLKKASGL